MTLLWLPHWVWFLGIDKFSVRAQAFKCDVFITYGTSLASASQYLALTSASLTSIINREGETETWENRHSEVRMQLSQREWEMDLRPTRRAGEEFISGDTPLVSLRSTGAWRSTWQHKVIHEESFVEQVKEVNGDVSYRWWRTTDIEQCDIEHGYLVTRVLSTNRTDTQQLVNHINPLTPTVAIYSASQKKSPPLRFSEIFPKWLGILTNFLHIYYAIISTLEYKFLFKYIQLWQSYAILSATT